jgi:hypothetical protein
MNRPFGDIGNPTGASGSGKTAIAEAIDIDQRGFADVFHFDRVGVPSLEAMVTDYGSGDAWQRAKTLEWMVKIASLRPATNWLSSSCSE